MLDFMRVVCAVPPVHLADPRGNAREICRYLDLADQQQADVVIFPELALTGATCQDLFGQEMLYRGVLEGVKTVLADSREHPLVTLVLGLPVRSGDRMFNCAAAVRDGRILGLTAKASLSQAERRWFTSSRALTGTERGELGLEYAPAISDLLLVELGDGAKLGIEIGEDAFSPIPRGNFLAMAGGQVIVNLASAQELAGMAQKRLDWVRHQSGALHCIYLYCGAGSGESTQDGVCGGQCLIGENGRILSHSQRIRGEGMLVQDCDLGRIAADRRKWECFREQRMELPCVTVGEAGNSLRSDGKFYPVRKLPFIPEEKAARRQRCREIFEIQVAGLKRRLEVLGAKAVIGISGGLDSTLALLVAVEAMKQQGRPMTDVYGVTMPCFGTSQRTYHNSWELMDRLGITAREIPIGDAVKQHFRDIGHDPQVHDATYENAQARERTQILMDLAGECGGIVVGTGDLSELALGWCTYNGDHMSMYGMNASVPKTLIRWIIQEVAQGEDFLAVRDVLADILDTPISPELLPPDETGKILQQTEDLVGPYALHDFFLYQTLRFGFGPEKVYALACRAFREEFSGEVIKKWLAVFYRRFFTQQFKRDCVPDGVKVGTLGLGPRGDWQMPSDAVAKLWLEETEKLSLL